MGVLKYAILGLLYQRPRSGYEMAQEFQDTLNEFTERQAQPDLPRAEEDDRRRAGGVPGGGRGYVAQEEALLHHAQGARGVHEVDERRPGAPMSKSGPRLQVFFSGCLPAERRIEMLEHQLKLHRERLEHLRGNQRKFSGVPPQDTPEFGDYLVLMHAVMREENDCRWLERCVELCGGEVPE